MTTLTKPKYVPGGWMHYVARAKQLQEWPSGEQLPTEQYKVLMMFYIKGKSVEEAVEEITK